MANQVENTNNSVKWIQPFHLGFSATTKKLMKKEATSQYMLFRAVQKTVYVVGAFLLGAVDMLSLLAKVPGNMAIAVLNFLHNCCVKNKNIKHEKTEPEQPTSPNTNTDVVVTVKQEEAQEVTLEVKEKEQTTKAEDTVKTEPTKTEDTVKTEPTKTETTETTMSKGTRLPAGRPKGKCETLTNGTLKALGDILSVVIMTPLNIVWHPIVSAQNFANYASQLEA